jgi:hypothetical protein
MAGAAGLDQAAHLQDLLAHRDARLLLEHDERQEAPGDLPHPAPAPERAAATIAISASGNAKPALKPLGHAVWPDGCWQT